MRAFDPKCTANLENETPKSKTLRYKRLMGEWESEKKFSKAKENKRKTIINRNMCQYLISSG